VRSRTALTPAIRRIVQTGEASVDVSLLACMSVPSKPQTTSQTAYSDVLVMQDHLFISELPHLLIFCKPCGMQALTSRGDGVAPTLQQRAAQKLQVPVLSMRLSAAPSQSIRPMILRRACGIISTAQRRRQLSSLSGRLIKDDKQ
jgi:hypothetical protein